MPAAAATRCCQLMLPPEACRWRPAGAVRCPRPVVRSGCRLLIVGVLVGESNRAVAGGGPSRHRCSLAGPRGPVPGRRDSGVVLRRRAARRVSAAACYVDEHAETFLKGSPLREVIAERLIRSLPATRYRLTANSVAFISSLNANPTV